MIGYTTEFMSMTRGYGIINHTFEEFRPRIKAQIGGRRNGALISMDQGSASTYAILGLEDRGVNFMEPGTEVYEGMIVGEHNRENDLTVNITKTKHQTNVRSATKDQTQTMNRPRILTLEEALQFINDDELVEVTPESIRLRKKILNKNVREKEAKRIIFEKVFKCYYFLLLSHFQISNLFIQILIERIVLRTLFRCV